MFSSPAVVKGVVYIGSNDQNVYALNATTGAELWSYTTGYDVTSSPAVANGVVYVGSIDDNVYALNATTGAELVVLHDGLRRDIVAGRGQRSGLRWFRGRQSVRHQRRHGRKLWSYTTGSDVFSSPAVVNGVVYVGSGDGNLYAFGL